jgi:hypothetical protein
MLAPTVPRQNDPGVTDANEQLRGTWALLDRPGQRMFPPAAAQDQDVHVALCLAVPVPDGVSL